MYKTYGNISGLSFEDLQRLNNDTGLPESQSGAILVIEDVPTEYPSGPGTKTWNTHLLLDEGGNVVARSPEGLGEVQVRLRLGHFTFQDWEMARKSAIWWAANTSLDGTRVSPETPAGKEFNEVAERVEGAVRS